LPKDFKSANAIDSPIITGARAAGRVFGLKVWNHIEALDFIRAFLSG